MPQELQVLRCCECESFQVHIVKKDKKWVCKICNQKQTTQMVYGRGSGKECRLIVQELNMRRLQLPKESPTHNFELTDNPINENEHDLKTEINSPPSRWKEFLDLDDCEGSADGKKENGLPIIRDKLRQNSPAEFLNCPINYNKAQVNVIENKVVPATRTSKWDSERKRLEHPDEGLPSDDNQEQSKEVCQDYICISINTHETVIIKKPKECQTSPKKRIISRSDNENAKKMKFGDLKCSASSNEENVVYNGKSVSLENKENRGMDALEENEKNSNKLEKSNLKESLQEVTSVFESEHVDLDDLCFF